MNIGTPFAPVMTNPSLYQDFGPVTPMEIDGRTKFKQPGKVRQDRNGPDLSMLPPGVMPFGIPPLPFGGSFATGGIAPAGAVSRVGENGPEWIVPSGPTAVIPMGPPDNGSRIAQSPMNRGYAPGSLADRPVRPIGRPMTAARRFEQLSRRQWTQGDVEGSARSLGLAERLDAGFQLPMRGFTAGGPPGGSAVPLPAAVPERPMRPDLPGPAGRLVPGRSAGSMVWQANAPPPTLDATTGQPVPSRPVPMSASPIQPARPPAEEPVNPFQLNPLGNFVNPTAGMVPSGFNAMNQFNAANGLPPPPPGLYGAEAPPRFQEYQAGEMNVIVDSTTGKQVQSYKRQQPLGYDPVPGMNLLLPRGDGADRLPVLQQQGTVEAPRPEAAFMGPMPGRPKLAPYVPPTGSAETQKIPEGIQYEKNALGRITGGVYPTYNERGQLVMKRIDMDGDGVVSPQEQAAAQSAAATQGKSARGAMWSLATP